MPFPLVKLCLLFFSLECLAFPSSNPLHAALIIALPLFLSSSSSSSSIVDTIFPSSFFRSTRFVSCFSLSLLLLLLHLIVGCIFIFASSSSPPLYFDVSLLLIFFLPSSSSSFSSSFKCSPPSQPVSFSSINICKF